MARRLLAVVPAIAVWTAVPIVWVVTPMLAALVRSISTASSGSDCAAALRTSTTPGRPRRRSVAWPARLFGGADTRELLHAVEARAGLFVVGEGGAGRKKPGRDQGR